LPSIEHVTPPDLSQAYILSAILEDHLDKLICRVIVDRAGQIGVPPQRVLLQEGWLTADQHVRALAAFHGVGFVALPDHAAPYVTLIDATGLSPAWVAGEIYTARGLGREPVLFISAIDALRRRQSEASAERRMWL
jgi:hypothetical protein